MADGAELATAFAATLRSAGLLVPTTAVVAFAEALGVVGMAERDGVYWSGRATLVTRLDDVAAYDSLFAVFWQDRDLFVVGQRHDETVAVVDDDADDDHDGEAFGPEAAETDVVTVRYSPHEVLRHKDFARYTAADHDDARRWLARFRSTGPWRRSSRRRAGRSSRPGARIDLRRTVRAALRTGGDPVWREWTAPAERPRRLVLLCDVSGSMEVYSRALLRFVQSAVSARQSVEAFTIGTRLTRLTRELRSHDPDAALARAAGAVDDWSGGTRLGDGLRTFNDRWGVRGVARGAVVTILSDGWDRGEPQVLAAELARLRRVAHRVVWANPLKATEGYAPLAGGMAAALPYVDDFVEGHSLAALERLAEVMTAP